VDGPRQIVRWSIPGSVFILLLGTWRLLETLILNHSFQVEKLPAADNTAVGAAFALITAIPLGFIIYQVYHYRYVRGRMFLLRSVVLKDRGADILRALPEETLVLLTRMMRVNPILFPMCERRKLTPFGPYALVLMKQYRTRSGRRLYQEARQTNWNIVRSYLDIVCMKTDSTVVKTEYTSISDIYHAQGATRISIIAAWVAHFGYSVFQNLGHFDEQSFAKVGALIVITLLSFVLWVIITEVRAGTYTTMHSTLRNSIVWLAHDWDNEGNPPSWPGGARSSSP
jgi:hypothetical protein